MRKSNMSFDMKASDNGHQDNKYALEGKSDCQDPPVRRSTSELMAKNEQLMSAYDGACECSSGPGQCSPEERFLTRSVESRNKTRQRERDYRTKLEGVDLGQDIDDEMFHVLVTRPEIAGKPRDNIVFEGDMDLRTTFETSYENLAKMRLDYWKQRKHTGINEQGSPQEQAEVSVEKFIKHDRSTSTAEISEPTIGPNHLTTKGVDLLNRKSPVSDETPIQVIEASTRETDNKLSSKLDSLRESNQKEPFIDPDLSSIIVYDANMNRLEKVGIRKRSKYRPSTSLRTGSRGLFGDQAEEVATPAKTRSVPLEEQPLPNHEGPKQTLNEQSRNQEMGQNELALSARNLNSSRQARHLTYSPQNLPVDSKRKLKDNVNMRDHIKEQNICATHSDTVSFQQMPTNVTESNDGGYLDGLRLAQQEEVAAVEELQRVTSLPAQDSKYESNLESIERNHAQSAASNKSDRESRQARLERTCQNQSFYLFENQYPENKNPNEELSRQSRATTQSHRHPVSYNNLFRESPDFILTTRGLTDDSQKLAQLNEAQAKPEMHQDQMGSQTKGGSLDIDYNSHAGQQDDIPIKCRVLRLEEDFEYVGSQDGHNFFAEKQQKFT